MGAKSQVCNFVSHVYKTTFPQSIWPSLSKATLAAKMTSPWHPLSPFSSLTIYGGTKKWRGQHVASWATCSPVSGCGNCASHSKHLLHWWLRQRGADKHALFLCLWKLCLPLQALTYYIDDSDKEEQTNTHFSSVSDAQSTFDTSDNELPVLYEPSSRVPVSTPNGVVGVQCVQLSTWIDDASLSGFRWGCPASCFQLCQQNLSPQWTSCA